MIQPADVEVWLIAIMQKNRPRGTDEGEDSE